MSNTVDIRELQERIERESSFVDALTMGMNQVIVGQKHLVDDGKSADYSGDAPSGDSSANFIGTIKPEMFSITNTIDFVWKDASGASTYSANPEGATWGRCDWDLGGLRADGPVKMRGTFMLRRLSNDPELDD